MSAPEVEPSACAWCGIAQRGHGRQYADAVGWHGWEQPSQEQILARMKARRLQLAVARAGAFPMPAGGERTLDVVEEELTGVNLALWEEIQAYARLRLALTSAQHGRRELRARVAQLENVEVAVAEQGALPMLAGPVVQPLAVTEAQIDALVAAGNRVVNDEVHKHLCMCDAWPEKCVSTGHYFMGAWDVDGLEAALPAVLGLWERMRGGELERLRSQATDAMSDAELLRKQAETLRAGLSDVQELATRWGLEAEALRTRVAELEAAPTTVYRAEHPDSGITLGHYRTIAAAHQHCETLARREGNTGIASWVPDDSDPWSPEELTFFDVEYCDGDDVPVQTCTGYVVTPLSAPSEYDEEADE